MARLLHVQPPSLSQVPTLPQVADIVISCSTNQSQLPPKASDLRSSLSQFVLIASVGLGSLAAHRRRRHKTLHKATRDPYSVQDSDLESTSRARDPYKETEVSKETSTGKDEGFDIFKAWNDVDPELQEDIKTFASSLAVALAIRSTLIEPRFIPSLSMYPTFEVGDQLTVDKISKNWRGYQRRDVVVFNPPPSFFQVAGGDRNGEALIKRIVAKAGDVVQVKDGGQLYINGEKQDEPYTNENARYNFGPVSVPTGCVFVLGDNRNASLDGHVWGFLPEENIIGRATLKFWPPWRINGVFGAPP